MLQSPEDWIMTSVQKSFNEFSISWPTAIHHWQRCPGRRASAQRVNIIFNIAVPRNIYKKQSAQSFVWINPQRHSHSHRHQCREMAMTTRGDEDVDEEDKIVNETTSYVLVRICCDGRRSQVIHNKSQNSRIYFVNRRACGFFRRSKSTAVRLNGWQQMKRQFGVQKGIFKPFNKHCRMTSASIGRSIRFDSWQIRKRRRYYSSDKRTNTKKKVFCGIFTVLD